MTSDPRLKALYAIQEHLVTTLRQAVAEHSALTGELKTLRSTWPDGDPNGVFFIGESTKFLESLQAMCVALQTFEKYVGQKTNQWLGYRNL